MKRIVTASLAALLVVACQDGGVPTPPEFEEPSFAILDGSRFSTVECTADDPCYHFFFFTPLVPTPKKFNGEFNPYVVPTVVISNLMEEDPATFPYCENDPGFVREFSSEIAVDVDNERYHVNWQTGDDDLTTNDVYRVCVKLGQITLGYRDVQPVASGAEVPRNPEQEPILQFRNGSNLPIKFRIEKGVLCSNDANCGEMALDPNGGSFATNTGLAGLYVPDGSLDGTYNLVVEEVSCPKDEHGNVRFLPMDIPQFPGCYEVYAAEGSVTFGPEDLKRATVGVCYNETAVRAAMAVADQEDLLQIHHLTADGTLEALPNVPAPAGVACPESGASADAGWLRNMARGVRKVLNPWFSPQPLAASHKGFGGGDLAEGSPLVWALPAKMEIVQPEGGVGSGIAGLPLDPNPTVKITDELDRPVQNATLGWAITAPASAPQSNIGYLGAVFAGWTGGISSPYITPSTLPLPRAVSGADGLVSVEWTLAVPNPNTLTATGEAIGVGTMFTTHNNTEKTFPGTGVLTFSATAIVPFEFEPDPPSETVYMVEATGIATIDDFSVCAVGRVEGAEIETMVAIKNNGDPVELGGTLNLPVTTGSDGCYHFSGVTLNKTGAYRLVVNGDFESLKFNVRPPSKK